MAQRRSRTSECHREISPRKNITYENLNRRRLLHRHRVASTGLDRQSMAARSTTYSISSMYTAALEDRFVIITGVRRQTKVSTVLETKGFGYPISIFFVQDIVVLNFGPFTYQRLYNSLQQASCHSVSRSETRSADCLYWLDESAVVGPIWCRTGRRDCAARRLYRTQHRWV